MANIAETRALNRLKLDLRKGRISKKEFKQQKRALGFRSKREQIRDTRAAQVDERIRRQQLGATSTPQLPDEFKKQPETATEISNRELIKKVEGTKTQPENLASKDARLRPFEARQIIAEEAGKRGEKPFSAQVTSIKPTGKTFIYQKIFTTLSEQQANRFGLTFTRDEKEPEIKVERTKRQRPIQKKFEEINTKASEGVKKVFNLDDKTSKRVLGDDFENEFKGKGVFKDVQEFQQGGREAGRQYIKDRPLEIAAIGATSFGVSGVFAAASKAAPVVVPLVSKGVTFGSLTLFTALKGEQIRQAPTAREKGAIVAKTGIQAAAAYTGAKAFQGTQQLASNIKTKVQDYRQTQQFKKLVQAQQQKGTQFRLKEQIGTSQRDLYGRSLSQQEIKANKLEVDKYKVGYGIEQNSLNPVSTTARPTGQTKLLQDKIIAVDVIKGTTAATRVVNGQVFVQDARTGQFVEFVGGTQKLITIPANQQVIGALNYRAIPYTDGSVQTQLVKPTINTKGRNIISDLSQPSGPKTTSFKAEIPSGPSPTGQEAVTTARLAPIQSLEGINRISVNTQYTPPPTTTNTPTTPIDYDKATIIFSSSPIGKVRDTINTRESFSYSPFPRESINPKSFSFTASDSNIKAVTNPSIRPISTSLSTSKSRLDFDSISKPIVNTSLDIKQSQTQLQEQKQDTAQLQLSKQITAQTTTTQLRTITTPQPPPTPTTPLNITTTPTYTLIPDLKLPKGRARTKTREPTFNLKSQPTTYNPTVYSIIGNIRAEKTSKIGVSSGLGVRPIIDKKTKKKRKKGVLI